MFRKSILAVLCLFGVVGGAVAAELQTGDAFPQLSLPDQHDQVTRIPQHTRIVLFAADKAASDLLNDFLAKQAADLLPTNNVEYIADISGMPGLITRWIALPRMREQPYRILLAKNAELVAFLPRMDAAVTVIRLKDARVEVINHVSTETELARVFN